MPRDSFKKGLQFKSRVEHFADVLESLFALCRNTGTDPAAVLQEVEKRTIAKERDKAYWKRKKAGELAIDDPNTKKKPTRKKRPDPDNDFDRWLGGT